MVKGRRHLYAVYERILEKDFLSLLDFWKSIYYKESASI